MPEGLQYALSAKLSSEGPRVVVTAYETGPSLFLGAYVDEIIENCLMSTSEGNASAIYVHYLRFVCCTEKDFTVEQSGKMSVYDFTRQPSNNLESLCELLLKAVSSKPGKSHVLIIDDFCMFSILTCGRDLQVLNRFLLVIPRHFRKMYLFFHKDTMSSEEISILYDRATDIAYLRLHPDYTNEISESKNRFTCDLLKIRNDRRATHEKSVFQVFNGEIKEERLTDQVLKEENSAADLLKNLTTFKLTLEDGERETKNKLHLPYFEAQKTSLEDPDTFDDDFDEEDEEV